MTVRTTKRLHRTASVITLVLLAIVILLALGASLSALDVRIRTWTARTISEIASRTAADAGLVKVVAEMNEKLKAKPWADSNLPQVTDECLPNCDATFSYSIVGDANEGYTASSVGRTGLFERKVNAVLKLKSLFDNAIYATTRILMVNNAFVDAGKGGIATDPDGEGTTLDNSAEVRGEIRTEPWDLPVLMPPGDRLFEPSKGVILDSTVITPADSGRYDRIGLWGNEELVIDSTGSDDDGERVTLYVTGNIALMQSAKLKVLDGSSLVVYLGGNFVSQGRSQINMVTADAKKCLIVGVGDGQLFYLDDNVDFTGVIYAPHADIHLTNDVDFTGAIVGENVLLSNRAKLHCDESLASSEILDFGLKFVVDRWWQGGRW